MQVSFKVGLVSLGCAKNLVDSEVMLGLLSKDGYNIISDYSRANILLINTCGFISTAKEESVNAILELAQYKTKGDCKLLIVIGCLVQKYQHELCQEIPEVDIWLGTDQTEKIVEVINDGLAGSNIIQVSLDPSYIYQGPVARLQTTPKHTAYLKIAEGCNNLCSYCVIPQMRGQYRSRPLETIIEEAKGLVKRGVVELIIIAQDTTMYGIDIYQEFKLVELLQELVRIQGVKWIRLLYCYPAHFDYRLIELIKKEEVICNYLDIPLQHADNEILKLMNRKSSQEEVVQLLTKLRELIPDIALRTTFIVGFPGEKKQHFKRLLSFIKEFTFNWAGVFPYSQEPDTPAHGMEDQVSEGTKIKRADMILKVQQLITSQLNQQYLGKKLLVLVEGISEDNPELFYGRTQYQAPEVDGITYFKANNTPGIGEFVFVNITHVDKYDLIGEMIP
ncbi:MAG: 30S ribosomal protein S12 methylthiotransferase RimO [Clostridia bacterium]|nr:30S ribosomal protein S12 methylthiotransferase RimO [Clostridia bacterium]